MQRLDLSVGLKAIWDDTPTGFQNFYEAIHQIKLPDHARGWIDAVYKDEGKNFLIEAFRGSTKTTTFVTFLAYKVGLYPERANMIIQVSDESAKENADAIAGIIEHNKMWKMCFPTVVPDRREGGKGTAWGAAGYNVKRTDIDYGDWQRKVAKRSGSSFVGYGRTARGIIGKHPDGVLLIDDIDDENTTYSDRERSKTQTLLKGTIFPMRTHTTLTVAIGTPWTFNDALAYIKSTGRFHTQKTPVYMGDSPTWPSEFHETRIQEERELSGELEFARMFLLDLEAASGANLKGEWLHAYPADDIDPSWPVVIGIDYASTADKLHDKDRDYFALAVGRLIPGGGVVLVDGYREHVSQGEAETLTRAWATNYATCSLVCIEAIGKGEEFYHLMLSNSRLPLYPATTGGKSKGNRFEKQMAPLFQMSRVWITSEENKFVNEFRDEWMRWDLAPHDDCLDACYYMIVAATQVGNLAPPTEFTSLRPWFEKREISNPYIRFGAKFDRH